jgi:4-oxalocrotonate tautomerase
VPLVRIDLPVGKSVAYRAALAQGVQDALVAKFNVPPDDRFQIISEHAPGTEIVRTPGYLGLTYSDDFTVIQITCNDTRNLEQKKALYAAIVDNLAANPGLRREDVFISLVEVKKENWSFGNGLAQYADKT